MGAEGEMAVCTMAHLAFTQIPLKKNQRAWLWLANEKHKAFYSRSLVHIQTQQIVATAEMLLSEVQSMACIE